MTSLTPIQEKNNSEEQSVKQKIIVLIKNNKLSIFLILFIVGFYLWTQYQFRVIEKNYLAQKAEIVHTYETKLDSANLAGIEQSAKLFSWAIRSELLRENKEQVNLFFLQFIKEKNIRKIQYIGTDNLIQISTDKKDEGSIFSNQSFMSNELKITSDSLKVEVAVPVMGYNSKMGTLIIESSKK